ncbi:MAG: alpha/beta hydrolase, partial [Candidatus Taylorbacteria bacterium]|nr:alpha/beta hydrolase [Candidatus Taylorbacteria bacterium]
QDAEIRKALAIIEILNERIPGKADVIAHSEGGINTAIAATFQAEKFNSIVFANAAGLMGPDNFPSLARRFGLSVAKDTLNSKGKDSPERKARGSRSLKETIKYIKSNFLRATEESGAISASQVDGVLKYLTEVGIGVIVVCGEDDPVFPIDRIKETLKDIPVDHFIVMPGGHTEIVTDPEAYMGIILEKLNEMEKTAKS